MNLHDRERLAYASGQLIAIAEILPLVEEVNRAGIAIALREAVDAIIAALEHDAEERQEEGQCENNERR